MSSARFFLSVQGRLGRGDFWTAWFLVAVLKVSLAFGLPQLGWWAALPLTYVSFCLFAKRVHDFGKGVWLAGIPFALEILVLLLRIAFDRVAETEGFGSTLFTLSVVSVSCATASLVLLVRLALVRGDPVENAYGPPPSPVLTKFGRPRAA